MAYDRMLWRMTEGFKQGCFRIGLNRLLSRCVNLPIILCFHRITPPSSSFFDRRLEAIAPQQFEWILSYVGAMGYRFVPLEKMHADIQESRLLREAVVTFDDGFRDQYENAYPVLKRWRIPATLFLITSTVDATSLLWLHKLYILLGHMDAQEAQAAVKDYVGREHAGLSFYEAVRRVVCSPDRARMHRFIDGLAQRLGWTSEEEARWARQVYLTSEQIRVMRDNGVAVESHGHEHLPVDSVSPADIRRDILQSTSWIEEHLGYRARFFGYPFGFVSPVSVQVLRELGCVGACTTEHRPLRAGEDPFALPRVYRDGDHRARFAWRFSGFYLGAMRERLFR